MAFVAALPLFLSATCGPRRLVLNNGATSDGEGANRLHGASLVAAHQQEQLHQHQQYLYPVNNGLYRSSLILRSGTSDPQSINFSRNEFSRPIEPDLVLGSRRNNRPSRLPQRGNMEYHPVDIQADSDECQALARRFDLTDVGRLQAQIELGPELVVLPQGGVSVGAGGIHVLGSIYATVTQTCVRTNDNFVVDLEFPIDCIVRPVQPLLTTSLSSLNSIDEEIKQQEDHSQQSNNSKNNKSNEKLSNKKNSGKSNSMGRDKRRDSDRFATMNIRELEDILQQNRLELGDGVEVMEDEAIYPVDGSIDVGELVAQLFFLQLDPYPKKPGTDPMRISISG